MKKIAFFIFGIYLTTILNCTKIAEQQEVEKPNILFLFTDDHAKNALSIYNDKLIQTPNIDRIGKEGMVFNNAFVTNSLCGPSRATILTGKYSHLNGFMKNGDRFDGAQPTFPKLLQSAGYQTSIVGKWHLGTTPTGFDYYNVLRGQGSYYNPLLIENGDTVIHQGHVTDIITDLSINYLKDSISDKPFCMMVQYKAPHRNWMPHPRYFDDFADDLPIPETFYDDYNTRSEAAEKSDMRIADMFLSMDMKLMPDAFGEDNETGGLADFNPAKNWENNINRMSPEQLNKWMTYYGPINEFYKNNIDNWSEKELAEWKYQRYMKDYLRCVKSVDDNIGRILKYLEENDLLENTLIVYSSDQGFYLGEHGWYDKRFMYEESFGTPMVMRYPDKIKAGSVSEEMVMNLDLAATFLEIAGAPVPDDMQGKSMLPLFSDPGKSDWRDAVYYHYYANVGWHSVQRHEGVRTKTHKLINFYDLDAWELYDLENDQQELNNISGKTEFVKMEDALKNKLHALRKEYKLPNKN